MFTLEFWLIVAVVFTGLWWFSSASFSLRHWIRTRLGS
jgi:hypothetical protein